MRALTSISPTWKQSPSSISCSAAGCSRVRSSASHFPADAGRQIHRKDFYRFMEALLPALKAKRALHQPEVLLITLDGRLSSSISDQAALRTATRIVLEDRAQTILAGHGFELERPKLQCGTLRRINLRHKGILFDLQGDLRTKHARRRRPHRRRWLPRSDAQQARG